MTSFLTLPHLTWPWGPPAAQPRGRGAPQQSQGCCGAAHTGLNHTPVPGEPAARARAATCTQRGPICPRKIPLEAGPLSAPEGANELQVNTLLTRKRLFHSTSPGVRCGKINKCSPTGMGPLLSVLLVDIKRRIQDRIKWKLDHYLLMWWSPSWVARRHKGKDMGWSCGRGSLAAA